MFSADRQVPNPDLRVAHDVLMGCGRHDIGVRATAHVVISAVARCTCSGICDKSLMKHAELYRNGMVVVWQFR